MKMAEEVVGPYMLIFGILLGIMGVVGVIYWIKKQTKATDKEVFGLQSSHFEKNDMMVKFYTQNQTGEDPAQFLKRQNSARNRQEDLRKPLVNNDSENQINS